MVYSGGELAPTANYADINQDGVNEILIGTNFGMRIFTLNGSIMTTGAPSLPSGDYRYPVAVGRLDDDEFDDIVILEASGVIYGFPSASDPFQIALTESPDPMSYFIPADESRLPKLFLKDINNDGIDEIHYSPGVTFNTRNAYYFIYNADGSQWDCGFPLSPGYKRCLPADLDGDGMDEIYCYGNDLAEFDACGNWIRAVPVKLGELSINDYHLDMSAVDIDDDGKSELILHGYFNLSPAEALNNWIFAYDEGLQLKSGWPHDLQINARALTPGHPVFGDLDNDGTLEYFMVHNDWEYGYVHAWRLDGEPVLGEFSTNGIFATSNNPACFSAPLIVDCDNDGFTDIVVASNAGIMDVEYVERIEAFNISTDLVDGYPLVISNEYIMSRVHIPVFGDINQDGFLDVVYSSDHGNVAFANFSDYEYNPELSFCPMWRYNRSLNATMIPSSTGDEICGDANSDEEVNIGDAVTIISYIFRDGPAPEPECSADASGDDQVDVGDVVYLINYIFRGGAPAVEDCCL
jgi:hypothetical protein